MAFNCFFRDPYTPELIREHAVPWLRTRRYIDIWHASCASGAESYTLAIIVREAIGEFQFRNMRIFPTGLDGRLGDIISEAIQRVPEALAEWFEPIVGSGCLFRRAHAVARDTSPSRSCEAGVNRRCEASDIYSHEDRILVKQDVNINQVEVETN